MRFLDLTLPTIEENLALDEVLLNEVEDGGQAPLLRVWELPRYAVVLGASGRLEDEVFVERCRREDVPIARRSSGGGTVVVGPGAWNFTVVLARDSSPGLDAVDVAQRFVLERVAESLRALGEPVEVRGSGDLTVGLRKTAGSAQRRLKHHFLVHATVLYDFALDRIPRYLRTPSRQPSYREGRAHEDFVANLNLGRDAVFGAIRAAWPATGPAKSAPLVPFARVLELVEVKFGDPKWVARL